MTVKRYDVVLNKAHGFLQVKEGHKWVLAKDYDALLASRAASPEPEPIEGTTQDAKQKLREFQPDPVEWMNTIRNLLFDLGMKKEMANWTGSLDGWGAAFEWIKYHVKRSQSIPNLAIEGTKESRDLPPLADANSLYPERYAFEHRDCVAVAVVADVEWTREQLNGMQLLAVQLMDDLEQRERQLLSALQRIAWLENDNNILNDALNEIGAKEFANSGYNLPQMIRIMSQPPIAAAGSNFIEKATEALRFAKDIIDDQTERFHQDCRCKLCESLPMLIDEALAALPSPGVRK